MRVIVAVFSVVIFLSGSVVWGSSVGNAEEGLLVPVHIKKGTSLIRLTRLYCTSQYHWKKLAEINGLTPPYTIYEGKTVQIPLDLLKKEMVAAKIAYVTKGVFRVIKDGSLQQIKKEEQIYPGQTIVTEKNGFAHLVFPDNKYVRISGDSLFTITYSIRLVDQSLKAEFFLKRGKVSIDVKKKLKKNDTFNTRSPVSVTGIRGTAYRMKMDGNLNIIETLRGKVLLAAAGKKVEINEGEGIVIRDGKLSSGPQNLPPAPQVPVLKSVYRELSPRIPSPIVDDGYCFLYIAVDPEGKKIVWSGRSENGGDFVVSGLEDGLYYAFFTIVNSAQMEGNVAGPVPFERRTIPSILMFEPNFNGKILFGSSIDLQWRKTEGASSYTLQIARDVAFTDLVTEVNVKGTKYQQSDLLPGTYFFRIQAVAEDGFLSDFGSVDSVVLKEISSFVDSAAISSSREDISLRWQERGDDLRYDIEIARDDNFTQIVSSIEGLSGTEFTPGPLDPGTYRVRLRTILPTGEVSPWSSTRKLVIPPPSFGVMDGVILAVFLGLMLL